MTLWILDTDHISLYQRGYLTVIEQVISKAPQDLAVTIISIKEQMYGRLNEIKRASPSNSLVSAYSRLEVTVDYYKSIQILSFDQNAQVCFEELMRQKIRDWYSRFANCGDRFVCKWNCCNAQSQGFW